MWHRYQVSTHFHKCVCVCVGVFLACLRSGSWVPSCDFSLPVNRLTLLLVARAQRNQQENTKTNHTELGWQDCRPFVGPFAGGTGAPRRVKRSPLAKPLRSPKIEAAKPVGFCSLSVFTRPYDGPCRPDLPKALFATKPWPNVLGNPGKPHDVGPTQASVLYGAQRQ